MPIRFRKTFKVLPGVKINLSRGGISTTVGPRGFHLTFNKSGVRQSVGLPGTGLSESSYLVKKESEHNSQQNHETTEHEGGEVGCFPWGCLGFILVLAIEVYVGASAFGFLPENYHLSHILQQVGL